MLSFFVIILIILTTAMAAEELTAVVNTTSGPVRGQMLTTIAESVKYAHFAGIRYAQPPVEYLRFKPPVPVKPWTEVVNATVGGDECAQMNFITEVFEGSEDCLFLNVSTPVTNLEEIPEKLKSVMVWFHGDTFSFERSSTKKFKPDYLLEKDVVYVTVNYRLGAFGFLNLNHPNATGNAGLKDQNLALKWIQANIKNFGGNPSNVTLIGHGAGAASVGYHTLSDASAGLFHGAISMSGTALVPWAFRSPSKALVAAKTLGTIMGIKSNEKDILLATFYKVKTEKLVRAASVVTKTMPFTPTLEDASIGTNVFLSECSISKYISGHFSKVPQVLGFVRQESMLSSKNRKAFISTVLAALEAYPSSVISQLIDLVGSLEELVEGNDHNLFEILVNETSDILFASMIDLTQNLLAASNADKPVYYYTFDSNVFLRNTVLHSRHYGDTHNNYLPYLYWTPMIANNLGVNDPVAENVDRVSTMWTNFAKYGNPTPHWIDDTTLNFTWPTSGPSGRYLEIGTELTIGSRPINLNAEIIKSAMTENLDLTNGCKATTVDHSCRNDED